MNRIGIVCIDAVPTVGIQLRVNEIKPHVDKTVLFTQHWTITPRNYWGIPVVAGMENLKAWLENEADSGTVLVNYRQRIKDFDPGKYPEPIKGVWHELHAAGSTAYGMEAFRGVSAILGKTFLMMASDFVGKELKQVEETVEKAEEPPAYETTPKSNEIPVVVSITTYRERFPILYRSLGSIFNQTVKPKRICVAVDEEDAPYIDGFLKESIEANKVELLVGSRSLGPHNKYVHAMLRYPDDIIITFDDDAVYQPTALENLWRCHCKYPDCVCARRVHRIVWDVDGKPLKYCLWENQCVSISEPSFDLFATGVGGVLYPAGVFSWTGTDIQRMREYRNDDLFLKHVENQLGIAVVHTGDPKDADPRIKEKGAQQKALLNINVNQGNNDAEIERLGLAHKQETLKTAAPFFRVIIPVYKSTETLRRAIASIEKQTYRNYVVSVCDDGSPQELAEINRRTVESLGERGAFQHYSENLFAGHARNVAMMVAQDAKYTLFLDADDEFAYPELFSDLYSFSIKNNFPDVIVLPAYRRNQGSSLGYTLKATTVERYATDRRFETPWSKCVKTTKVKEFQEGIRRCNDVIQHWRVVDDIKTVAPFAKEAVIYHQDSETTMFGPYGLKNRQQVSALTGYLRCATELLETKWQHDYVSEQAALEANSIITLFVPNLIRNNGTNWLKQAKKELDRDH